jgi:hypothetical protein
MSLHYCFVKKNKYLLFLNNFIPNYKIYKLSKFHSFYKKLNLFFLLYNKKNKFININKFRSILLLNKKYPLLYTKTLILKGRGYKCILEKKERILLLKIGFSHSIKKFIPNKIKINLKKNKIVFKSLDRLLLKRYSLSIKLLRKISAYKKKGLYFSKDILKFKQVKKK